MSRINIMWKTILFIPTLLHAIKYLGINLARREHGERKIQPCRKVKVIDAVSPE